MSRGYLLRIPTPLIVDLIKRVKQRGRFGFGFGILDILDRPRMRELIREVLVRMGWRDQDGILEKQLGSHLVGRIDLENLQAEVDVTALLEHPSFGPVVEGAINLRMDTDWDGIVKAPKTEEDAKALSPEIQRRVREALEGAIDSPEAQAALLRGSLNLRRTINEALKDVYREALKEKAATLGNVTSVTESSEGGTYRLRLEIGA